MKKSLASLLLIVLIPLFLIGCNNKSPQPTTSKPKKAGSELKVIKQISGDLYGNDKPERVSLAEKVASIRTIYVG